MSKATILANTDKLSPDDEYSFQLGTDTYALQNYLYAHASHVTNDLLKPDLQQHAKHRPMRMYDAITDLAHKLDYNEAVISFCLLNRGLQLLRSNETTYRLIKINMLFGQVIKDDEGLDSLRAQRYKNNTKQSHRETHFYCGKSAKRAISKLADPFGMNLGDIAQYLWLTGLADYELNPIIKESLMKTLDDLNTFIEDRLVLFERFAKRKGIDTSDI